MPWSLIRLTIWEYIKTRPYFNLVYLRKLCFYVNLILFTAVTSQKTKLLRDVGFWFWFLHALYFDIDITVERDAPITYVLHGMTFPGSFMVLLQSLSYCLEVGWAEFVRNYSQEADISIEAGYLVVLGVHWLPAIFLICDLFSNQRFIAQCYKIRGPDDNWGLVWILIWCSVAAPGILYVWILTIDVQELYGSSHSASVVMFLAIFLCFLVGVAIIILLRGTVSGWMTPTRSQESTQDDAGFFRHRTVQEPESGRMTQPLLQPFPEQDELRYSGSVGQVVKKRKFLWKFIPIHQQSPVFLLLLYRLSFRRIVYFSLLLFLLVTIWKFPVIVQDLAVWFWMAYIFYFDLALSQRLYRPLVILFHCAAFNGSFVIFSLSIIMVVFYNQDMVSSLSDTTETPLSFSWVIVIFIHWLPPLILYLDLKAHTEKLQEAYNLLAHSSITYLDEAKILWCLISSPLLIGCWLLVGQRFDDVYGADPSPIIFTFAAVAVSLVCTVALVFTVKHPQTETTGQAPDIRITQDKDLSSTILSKKSGHGTSLLSFGSGEMICDTHITPGLYCDPVDDFNAEVRILEPTENFLQKYNPEVISKIKKFLRNPDLTLASVVCMSLHSTTPPEVHNITKNLVISLYPSKSYSFLRLIVAREVYRTGVAGSLFREDSISMHLLASYGQLVGRKSLAFYLGPTIEKICQSDSSLLEVEERWNYKDQAIEANIELVCALCKELFYKLKIWKENAPKEIIMICGYLKSCVQEAFPTRIKFALTTFLFKSLICQVIAFPESAGIVTGHGISQQTRRALRFISRNLLLISRGSTYSMEGSPQYAKINKALIDPLIPEADSLLRDISVSLNSHAGLVNP
eukprot:TRINITY_DN8742_c0_g1_i5.p1 TRINITY_DN8742_c0_g1~~TRINITY_DN8742_c0_g1_i5.p1  ORF type:complete len:855 (-),score=82.78 TRINITY_DN8742_c0_g1_i5:517-3081(-)